jgi:hypothetical protein
MAEVLSKVLVYFLPQFIDCCAKLVTSAAFFQHKYDVFQDHPPVVEPILIVSSTSLMQSSTTSEFALFAKLPGELRNQIWELAIQDIKPRTVCAIQTRNGSNTPSIFRACSNSRTLGLKTYRRCVNLSNDYVFFLNYSIDTLYLNPGQAAFIPYATGSLATPLSNLVHCSRISGLEFKKVQRLAMSVKHDNHNLSHLRYNPLSDYIWTEKKNVVHEAKELQIVFNDTGDVDPARLFEVSPEWALAQKELLAASRDMQLEGIVSRLPPFAGLQDIIAMGGMKLKFMGVSRPGT